MTPEYIKNSFRKSTVEFYVEIIENDEEICDDEISSK